MAGVAGGPPKPAILASPSAYCATLCHSRVMPSDKVFFKEMELQFPHALHVKDVGIECAKCHSPEKHKMRIVTKSECMKCHHESKDIDCGHCHKAQQALYEGKVKAYGATPAPDVMAAGKTKCVECHDLKKGTQTVLTVKAKCEGCHDAKYGKMLLDWKQEITKQENAIAVALEEAKEYVSPHEEGRKGRLEGGDAGPPGGRELPGGLRRPRSPQPQAQQGDAPGGAGRHRQGAGRQAEEVTRPVNKKRPVGIPTGRFSSCAGDAE